MQEKLGRIDIIIRDAYATGGMSHDDYTESTRLLIEISNELKAKVVILDWVTIKDDLPPKGKRIFLYNIDNDDFHYEFVHEYDLTTQRYQKNWTHWALVKAPKLRIIPVVPKEDRAQLQEGNPDSKLDTKLHDRVTAGINRELRRQKLAGKEFPSDEVIDNLVDGIIKEELGDNWKEKY